MMSPVDCETTRQKRQEVGIKETGGTPDQIGGAIGMVPDLTT